MVSILYSTARGRKLNKLNEPKNGAWVHAVAPTETEIRQLAANYELDVDLLHDAVDLYEAPRVEASGGTVYIYTRYGNPDGEEVATEPLLIILTPNFLFTILRMENPILDRLLEVNEDVITTQKTKLLLQILSEINASYRVQLTKISRKILSIRAQLRKTEIDNATFVQFIDMEEDLNEFLTALQPQAAMLTNLTGGKFLKLYEADQDLIEDLTLGTHELVELSKSRRKTISNTREAYATIMANTLNKTFKRLTSISIFMTIPMITTGLYGMNLALPLARNQNAFWYILLIVMGMTSIAIWFFQRKKWL